MRGAGPAIVLACVALLLLGCDEKAPATKGTPPELNELVRNAEIWASRAEAILMRSWATRLAFRQRLYGRVQTLRSFVQEGAAAANGGAGPFDKLLERGRALVDKVPQWDSALALVDRLTPAIDAVVGSQSVIELHMKPLETRGEAPFRIRVSDLEKQVKLVFTHLDEALARILDGGPDTDTHQKIATHNLSAAIDTAKKLTEEIKIASELAAAAVFRQKILEDRIVWAQKVAAKLGQDDPKDGREALEAARALSKELPAKTDAVVEAIRSAQPDATTRANDLAKEVDAVVERLTRAYLDPARKVGIGDPK